MNNTSIMMLNDERALINRATTEPDAFATIFDHYFPRVYNYVRYRVHDAQTADDLTALIFERAWKHLDSYRSRQGAFAGWLFAIARNAVNDHYRQRRDFVSIDDVIEQPSAEPAPEDIQSDNEMRAQLLNAVSKLVEADRELIALKFGAGMSNVEIARVTGRSESNVAVRVHRALQQLKGFIKE
jgi:RNA polymerase sigma-70 factor, ECF subfamily